MAPDASPRSVCFPRFHCFLRKKVAQYKPFPRPRSGGIPAQVEPSVSLEMFLEAEMNEKMCSSALARRWTERMFTQQPHTPPPPYYKHLEMLDEILQHPPPRVLTDG